jgi:hypothetical protein
MTTIDVVTPKTATVTIAAVVSSVASKFLGLVDALKILEQYITDFSLHNAQDEFGRFKVQQILSK